MEDLFKAVAEAPVANLFIIGGLIFIAIAVLGKVSGKIEPSKAGRIASAILGTVFLFGGLGLHLATIWVPRPTPTPTQEATVSPTQPIATDVPTSVAPTSAPPTATARPPAQAPTAAPTLGQAAPTRTPAQPALAPTATSTPAPVAPLPAGSWQKIGDLPRQINGLAADPTNPQVLYAGTGDAGSGSGVYRSADAGLSWARVANGLPDEDVKAVAVACGNGCTLLASQMREVYASADEGANWARLADSGSFGSFYHRLYVDPGDSRRIYLVAQPNGPVRSTDGGNTWIPLSNGLPAGDNEVYVLSLAIDPSAPNVLYAGTGGWVGHGQGVFKSTDGGESWTASNRGMLDYRISSLAVDPQDPQRIYAGGDAGELFISADGGQTWEDASSRLPYDVSSHATVKGISINPSDGRIYMLCNFKGVLYSADRGASWQSLGVPGEGQPVYTVLAVVHGSAPVIIAGVEREGAWRYAVGPQ